MKDNVVDQCDLGTFALKDYTCVSRCPPNTIPLANWTESKYTRSKCETATNQNNYLEFNKVASGLKLATSSSLSAINFPNDFSLSFWIYPSESGWSTDTIQYLVHAFGWIYIWKADKDVSGIRYHYPVVSIGNVTLTPKDEKISTNASLPEKAWSYIGISKRTVINKTENIDYVEIHLVVARARDTEVAFDDPKLADEDYSYFEAASLVLENKTIINSPSQLRQYIVLGSKVSDDTDLPITGTSFSGYIREFKVVKHFMNATNLVKDKYHVYSQYHPELLVYWKLDEASNNNFASVTDYSPYAVPNTVASSTNTYPRFTAGAVSEISTTFMQHYDRLLRCWTPFLADIQGTAGKRYTK